MQGVCLCEQVPNLYLPVLSTCDVALFAVSIIVLMSGSGGDAGYDYQADAIAYVAAHGLAGQPLNWFDGFSDVPATWHAETGGPGDDIQLATVAGLHLEVQSKHAFKRGEEYDETTQRLVAGLKNAPTLRAVLLVDKDASQIIREDLKHDLIRLGQGRRDGLKQVTVDLLDRLKGLGLDDASVFDRLRIVVVDLDEGSDGVSTATALLSHVVAPENSHSAYKLLGKRGHDLIKRRGRDDIYRAARFLNEKIGLAQTALSPAIVTTRFATWIHETNAHFYCPALQQAFPIDFAWSQVGPMEEATGDGATLGITALEAEIRRYQEWARLARPRRVEGTMDADAFVNSQRLTVIVGGPGSGKTTLGRKLAFVATEDRSAVRVRLSTVAALLMNGRTFENALIETAVDSSGLNARDGREILASVHRMIADGLDECDPRRVEVAVGLSRWAASHSQTSICVFTRPVGHSPAMLPGFRHAELLPLESEKVQKIVEWMIASKITDPSKAAGHVAKFMEGLNEKSGRDVASIAARNPLLLSFLVRLFLDGQSIEGRRAALFSRIVELIWNSAPTERISSGTVVDRATAWAAAEVVGWSSIEQSDRRVAQIYDLVSKRLGSGIDAAKRAELSIRQWEEHGLIERLTLGSLDAIVFVHVALGEYLAGRRLAALDPQEFEAVISQHRKKAKWREPILLCAGVGAAQRVIDALLALDNPVDPESTEALLAAAALEESEGGTVPGDTINQLAEHLKQRLLSGIPLVAVEAGLGLVSVAQTAPDLVGTIALEQWDHDQAWTRLAAICAGLAGGSGLIPTDKIVNWIKEFKSSTEFSFGSGISEWPSGTHDLQKAALPNALKRVAKELPPAEAEQIVVAFLTRPNISVAMMEAARSELKEEPYRSWAERAYRSVVRIDIAADMFERMKLFENVSQAAKEVVLNGILAACSKNHDQVVNRPSRFPLLATLLGSMGFWELPLSDVAAILMTPREVLQEVLRGAIIALNLDADKLSEEASNFLNRKEELLEIERRELEPDWNRLRAVNLNLQLLTEALLQESWFVAWNGARLFQACQEQSGRPDLLTRVLREGKGHSLHLVGFLANDIWGETTFEVLRDRLERELSSGCGFLYEPLIRNARSAEDTEAALRVTLNGVGCEDPKIAAGAAKALRIVESQVLARHRVRLHELLSHWKRRGSWCEGCKQVVHGNSCDKCHVVPPEPRKHLVDGLFRSGGLSFEQLVELGGEEGSGVAEEASKALVQWALTDNDILRRVIEDIEKGSAPDRLLPILLARPADELRGISDPLLVLQNASSPLVRARFIDSLSAGWLDAEAVRELAQKALLDQAPQVRTAATKILRERYQT